MLWLVASPVLGADPDLLKGANAIINQEEKVFTVHSLSKGTTHVKRIVTIYNEHGNDHAKLFVHHDKLNKVDFIKGTSYDANGKKIKSLKNSEIRNVSASTSDNEVLDNRIMIAELTHRVYPYQVEFEYQTTSSNMLFYPTWVPLSNSKTSVAKASFQVMMPKGMKLRYRESNLAEKANQWSTATHDMYSWQVSNLTPVEGEPYAPHMLELLPMVRTAPSDFEVQGYKGNMDTWEAYGKWINQLNQGRDALPEATKAKLQAMVAGIEDPVEKINKVYQYLQSNTRYVSIQLGLGGWQPFEASFVDSKGYGDCKALTNYTKAMLQAVGIHSIYALVNGGANERAVLTDFPSSQFNHVILSVPMKQDTLWLECTNQFESAGFSGSFTGDRHALLITPEGGKLVKTQNYTATDNVKSRLATVKLDESGNAVAQVQTRYTGIEHEDHRDVIHHLSPEEQRKWLYRSISIPAFDLKSFSFDLKKGRMPEVNEKLELSLRQFVTVSGKRMFLTPNLMNRWTNVPQNTGKRKYEVVRSSAYTHVDTIVYEMPAGFVPEFKPNDLSFSTAFGKFESKVTIEGSQVTYIRTLRMDKGRYKPEVYAAMVAFMNDVYKADQQQVVFVKSIQ
ncbi:Transglutaminase-like superfamily protein [Pontibacter indicus]|uniref:Transglutaminase-like superfamily protein n=2 Tax=Pontibacter indicus TaxID=1317125 RepID=A0A1R3XRU2_9BACT|nr:Transglutaminase-like superfamily protein [Pontibacter indicus]